MFKAILTDDWQVLKTKYTKKYELRIDAYRAAEKLAEKYSQRYKIEIKKI